MQRTRTTKKGWENMRSKGFVSFFARSSVSLWFVLLGGFLGSKTLIPVFVFQMPVSLTLASAAKAAGLLLVVSLICSAVVWRVQESKRQPGALDQAHNSEGEDDQE